ncbi:hypothetical protein JCM18899A_14130 [Nocardioides sp. AN3]
MDIAAFIVSLFAFVASVLSAAYTGTQARAAKSAERRARKPVLVVTLDKHEVSGVTQALYYVENQGGEDLDSVVVERPVTADGVTYPVARLGDDFGDETEVGPLEIRAKQGFILAMGSGESLPEFRVRIRTRIGKDTWEDAYVLGDPRFHVLVR